MTWPTFWQKTSWQTQLLRPLGAWVCWMAQRRLARFQASSPQAVSKVPLIVVGNIVVGGSGKTPFIIWLVQQLQAKGLKVGIVSRGYGGNSPIWPQRVTPDSHPALVGDEPVLLAKQLGCPIAVAPKRVQAVAALNDESLDVIISDDGLQHFAMARDLEIVLLDSERGLGNGFCLPAGPLREPASRLMQVDWRVYNGQSPSAEDWSMELVPVCFRQVAAPDVTQSLDVFLDALSKHNQPSVYALAGIGNPQRFFNTLDSLGLTAECLPFADHYAYRPKDFANLDLRKPLIMTEKDAVKCQDFAQPNWWYLQVEPRCSSDLARSILARLQALGVQPRSMMEDKKDN